MMTTDAAAPSAGSVARRPGWPWVVALGTVVVAVLFRLTAMTRWSWFQDDWVYTARAATEDFLPYVTQNYNGHLMPGQFALMWAMTRADPLVYGWAVLAVLGMGVASLLVWWRLLVALFGKGWVVPTLLVPIALSPVFVPLTLWTAAGLQTFSLQLFLGVSLLGAAWWLLDRRRVGLALAWAGLVGGLLFWEKALLILIPVAGLAVFAHLVVGRVGRRGVLGLLGPMVVISAVYIPLYLRATGEKSGAQPELGQARGFFEVLSFLWTALTQTLLPSLVGGPWVGQDSVATGVPTPPTWTSWLLVAGMVVVAIYALTHRPRAWIPLLTGAVYCVVAWGLVLTSSRYLFLGDFGALDPRYSADAVPVTVLMLGLALAPLRGESWRPTLTAAARDRTVWRSAPFVLLAVSCVFTSSAVWDGVRPFTPRPWVDNLVADATAVGPATIFNSNAPRNVVFAVAFPDDGRISQLLLPLSLAGLRYDEPTEQLLAVDGDGRLKVASIGDSMTSPPGPLDGCGYVVKPGETAFIPLKGETFAWNWGIVVNYLAQGDGAITIRTDNARWTLPVSQGLGEVQSVVVDSARALRVSVAEGTGTVCIDKVRLGLVSAGDQAPEALSAG